MPFKTVIRVTKLSTIGNIKASGEHTWRERQTDNADPERTHLNEDWRAVKSSAELLDAIQNRVAQAKQKSDNAVHCIEYLITAHKDAFKEGGGMVDSSEYFADSLKWLEAKHGKENIVAVNIQRDEQAPHMVAYVVPLVEVEAKTRKRSVVVGKDAEGKQIREIREFKDAPTVRLSAAEFLDGRKKLSAIQTDFSKDVGERHGLERGTEGSKARHESVRSYYARVNSPIHKTPSIDVPEPTMKDRLDPKKYGQQVASSVIEQITPTWESLRAKAIEFDALERRNKALGAREKGLEEREALNGHVERLNSECGALKEENKALSRRVAQLERGFGQIEGLKKLAESAEMEKIRADDAEKKLAKTQKGAEFLARAIARGGAELEVLHNDYKAHFSAKESEIEKSDDLGR